MEGGDKPVTSLRVAELVVGALFLIFGAVIMWDSRTLGAAWSSDGPQAGYFPFYIGLFIVVSAVAILLEALRLGHKGESAFVKRGELRLVLSVLMPTAVYVALIANPWFSLGIYVASALFIGWFMWRLGGYGPVKIAPVCLGVVVSFFLMFEIWFKVPLPKGPLEAALGFG
jgi:hypothetical protein